MDCLKELVGIREGGRRTYSAECEREVEDVDVG